MRFLPPILANLFLAVAALGWGSILRPLIPKSFSRLDRVVLILLGGLGILGTILFCVGQVWFARTAIIVVLLAGALRSVRPLAAAMPAYRLALKRVQISYLPAGIVLLVLLVTAVTGLALPIGDTNDDAIAYHYLGPKVWLREQVIRPAPEEIQTYFPVVVETQYAALMSLGGQRAPGFFAVIGLGALLMATAALAIRLGLDPTGAWWAAALVAAMPSVYRGAFGGFLDALFASFIVAAARIVFDAEKLGDFALFGIFGGISMATKYQGIVAWGLLVACSFLRSIWTYRPKAMLPLKWLTFSCAVAIVTASPFYVRNWILAGSPIYPAPAALLRLFTKSIPQLAAVQEVVRNLRAQGGGMGSGFMSFLLLPLHLTYHTANFRGAGGIGLAPLALGPFGLIARRRDPFALGLSLFAVLQLVAWFATAQLSRYIIHIYVIGAIFGVLGWKYVVDNAARNGRVLSATVIAISVLYGLGMILPARMGDLHAAVSNSYERNRWRTETPEAASFDYINSEPSVKDVLILAPGVAAYFLDKPYVSPFGRWGEQTLGAPNVQGVLGQLPRLRATHILDLVGSDGNFALPNHPPGLTLVFEHDNQRIYRIDDGEIAARASP